MKLKSLNIVKNKEKDFSVSDKIFAIDPRPDIMARVIRWQLSKKRSGNHKVKSRSEVSSTTAKIYRQDMDPHQLFSLEAEVLSTVRLLEIMVINYQKRLEY